MTDIKQRLAWCRGCDNLFEREQVHFFEEDGFTRIDPPLKIMQWYCREFTIHLDYIDRLAWCQDKDGKPKECPRYRN
jgi:hypothetical protein